MNNEMIPFEECPIGMFMCGGELCLKTEYGLEAYIVSSGERFWGGVDTLEQLRHVKVCPVEVEPVRRDNEHADLISRKYLLERECCGRISGTDVRNAPAVDAAPVRHGRWEWKDGAAYCTAHKGKTNPSLYGYGYCPLCGAKMDGESECSKG